MENRLRAYGLESWQNEDGLKDRGCVVWNE